MDKLVICVPNFSEGQNIDTINAIEKSIRDTPGCSVLDVDAGKSTNRTVYSFVGSPEDVVSGALNAAKVAYQLIDMSVHKGEHPRFGAMDVCPFVPVRGVTMDDCINCANQFGAKLAEELKVPVYLYAFAAATDERRLLPTIRSGEYEHVANKLQDEKWQPDYGPSQFVSRWGATAVGARNFLLAYNVNLISTKEQAHKIALDIRESGRGKSRKGRLQCVQAIGWYVEEQGLVQVSCNITDCTVTKLHEVFEEVCSDAKKYNLPVVGSEIVGLVPLQAILEAADFYIEKEKLFILEESHKVQLAINRLGLDSLGKFDPKKKIVEYLVQDVARDFPLSSLPVRDFVKSVASRTPAPGGGSVSAAASAMGAALCTMVGQLSYGKKQWESVEEVMRQNIPPVYNAMIKLLPLIDKDTTAFNSYMKARKMPKSTEAEIAKRDEALLQGILEAIRVPFDVMSAVCAAWTSVKEIARNGNPTCLSDIQVGAKCLETGAWGAYQNVLINLPEVKDVARKEQIQSEAQSLLKITQDSCAEVLAIVDERSNVQ